MNKPLTKPAPAIPLELRAKTEGAAFFQNAARLSENPSDWDEEVHRAVEETQPTGHGMINKKLFELMRWLAAIFPGVNSNYVEPIVLHWFERARSQVKTKDVVDTLREFHAGWPTIKYPKNASQFDQALERARDAQTPGLAKHLPPPAQLLAKLCRELQRLHGDEPFPLSCEKAGEVLGASKMTGNNWMRTFVAKGMVKEVRKGSLKGRLASEWLYLGSLYEDE